ncbi:hypothetical protein KBC86_01570 [Candidatus Gracilibacteria bacterium]|nr:hypothetical protein [Candidatus Gracilibacteria bacterium]
MDSLEFKIRDDDRVDIFINAKNLIEILREYEKSIVKNELREDIAGSYDGLFKDVLLNNLMGDNSIILGCQCGEEMCWPMRIKISKGDNFIAWNSFEQPYRGKNSHNYWNYDNFGEFIFDIKNYEKEVEKLKP